MLLRVWQHERGPYEHAHTHFLFDRFRVSLNGTTLEHLIPSLASYHRLRCMRTRGSACFMYSLSSGAWSQEFFPQASGEFLGTKGYAALHARCTRYSNTFFPITQLYYNVAIINTLAIVATTRIAHILSYVRVMRTHHHKLT